ncbi:MAG TPA: MASE1 domain-containing protein [Thermoanaerobaculia bacterium]|jgi:signal transduction histidine kinase/CheY-like chemotaxis protein|nr:MASE1 domain-containing protein [Thermoanaerobaculia bacterium]
MTTSDPPPRERWSRGPAYWVLLLVVAAVYFGVAKLGLSMAFLAEQVSPVWPATGFALAAVLLLGPRVWPGIALGALLANLTANEPLLVAMGIAAGNTLEALVGRWLLQQGRRFRLGLDGMADALALVGLAAGVSTTVAATVGVTSLCAGHVEAWSRFGALWGIWWLGDAMGALVTAPLLLTWLAPGQGRWPPRRALELSAGIALGAVVCALVFAARPRAGLAPGPSLEYAAFPFLVWAALRGGPRGAALVTFVTSAVAIGGTLAGAGPFAAVPPHEALVLLQTYMGVVAVTGLFLGAAVAERDRAERARAELSQQSERELRAEASRRAAVEGELRERAEQLADADRRKDEFLAMLGHELRNPLGAVSNALHVLRAGGEGGAPGRGARMLDVIERQVAHLTRLVGDLLEVSRITRGEISLRKEALDLRAVVVRAVETAQPWIDERGHRIALERPPQALTLPGDAMRLEQVFANLLHNAAKYTDPGGKIDVGLEREGDAAVVRVRDDGIGIQPELLPHVFELFTQGDRSLDRARGGLGIGLTLVRRIVELHGGTIEAHSEGVGRGAEMVVRLPMAEAAAAGEAEGASVTTVAKKDANDERGDDRPRMLIVEDQRDAAEGLAELMRMQGFAVEIALDGQAALASAAERVPAVVLLDLGLPGLDGYEVARRLRRLPGLEGALVVALSGYGRDEDRQRGREAGIDHHLVKPVELRELERVLAGVRGQRAAH